MKIYQLVKKLPVGDVHTKSQHGDTLNLPSNFSLHSKSEKGTFYVTRLSVCPHVITFEPIRGFR
jgi:hypothetical protein